MTGPAEVVREIEKRYGIRAVVVRFEMLYEEEVRRYVMRIEKAHEDAASSTLRFS